MQSDTADICRYRSRIFPAFRLRYRRSGLFMGPPRVAVFTVQSGFQSPLFTLLRLNFLIGTVVRAQGRTSLTSCACGKIPFISFGVMY